ncbi:hypothetical protein ACFW9U_27700 [Rhodococcus aetherivorans]|uniref:hypothetical protein n=1 Tax=Rhodococcus aetherivorans TaxID=191292 RepID=UPI003670C930
MTSRLAVAGCVPESIIDEVQRWYSAPGVGRWMDSEFDVSALVKQMAGSGRFVGKYLLASWGCVGFDSEHQPVAFLGADVLVDRSEQSDCGRPGTRRKQVRDN